MRRLSVSRVGLVMLASITLFVSACDKKSDEAPVVVSGPAPDTFRVTFETSKGPFVIEVVRAWAPLGADRFNELVQNKFFDDNRIFRVVPDFVAQWGLSGDRKINEAWDKKPIQDDPVRQSNAHYAVTYAHEGKNTRSHQVFINLSDNKHLDKDGFAVFGKVVEGTAVVDSLYSGYQESVSQHLIQTLGNNYLLRMFPKLDYIKTARVVTKP